jgi:hypothetical protein
MKFDKNRRQHTVDAQSAQNAEVIEMSLCKIFTEIREKLPC